LALDFVASQDGDLLHRIPSVVIQSMKAFFRRIRNLLRGKKQ
jgi:hypothetical protein